MHVPAGLCIVPCTHAPQVQDDSSCSISTGPEGDTLTFSMPAASMGLSTLQQNGRTAVLSTEAGNAGPGAVQDACAADEDVPAGAKVSTAGLPHGWCSCCRATPGSCRVCAPSFEPLPGALPHSAAGSTLRMEAQTAACADGCAGTAPDESWDVSDEAGSCVVEGDARLVVSHTAFVLLQCVCMHPGCATQPVVAVGQSQSSASGRRPAQLASVPVWCAVLQRWV